MINNTRRIGTALLIGSIAFVIAALNAIEFHEDIVIDGDPVIVAFGEVVFGFALATALFVAAYWTVTELSDNFVRRTSRWVVGASLVVIAGTGLVVLSQLIQSEVKWQLLFVDIVGLGVIAGLGIGYYDSYRRQQAETIKQERNEFKALFTNVPTAVLAIIKKGDRIEVDMVNPAFEEVFGYTEAELDGMDVREVLRPADEEPDPITDDSLTGLAEGRDDKWQEVQVTLKTEYGHREFVRISAPVENQEREDGPEEYAFYIDVTEQLQREERIQVMSRALRHDLRNRLTVIQGGAKTLVEEVEEDTNVMMADQIRSAAEELEALSEQTRMVETLVDNDYERGPMQLQTLIADVVEKIGDQYPEGEINIEISEELAVRADPTLQTAVENIVENAVEHNDTEHPSVEIAAVEALDSGFIDVKISDNGPGIPEEVSTVITGEVEADQLHHSPSGMGLWVANWIVNQHGGTLEMNANSPRGTIVTVRLPQADKEA